MKRRSALQGLALLALSPCALAADPVSRRFGVLSEESQEESLRFHREVLAPLFAAKGWVYGRNLTLVGRFANGDATSYDRLARELVAERPDVIATSSTPRTRALQRATSTIPIFTSVGDPVGSGFAQSLARPGGNITGLSQGTTEIAQKRVGLLKTLVPGLSRLLVFTRSRPETAREVFATLMAQARRANVTPELFAGVTLADVEAAMRSRAGGAKTAAYLPNTDIGETREIARLGLRYRIATLCGDLDSVEAGVLLSFTMRHDDELRLVATLLDKLLRGADPATMPFELPTRSELFVNRRTAAALGIALPAEILLQAEKVIE